MKQTAVDSAIACFAALHAVPLACADSIACAAALHAGKFHRVQQLHQPCMCESPVIGMFLPQKCYYFAGEDKRTTLMIKNIPNKYTQKMLLTTIDEKFHGTYDFFYLPIDFKNKCNVGYAFINMVRPEYIIPLIQKFDRKKWEKFNSEKVCNISYARIQVNRSQPFPSDCVHPPLF